MKKGGLFVVSGPSGVGKGTICKMLIEECPEIRLSVSATTRKPRKGEVEGSSYYFKSREEFMKMVSDGEMLEYAEVYGNFYGTPLESILQVIRAGRDVILEIEMDGALQVKRKYPEAVLIFVLPPSLDVLLQRIIGRGTETEESIRQRMSSAAGEIDRIVEYDFFIINDIMKKSVENLKYIIDNYNLCPESTGIPKRLEAMKVDGNGYVDLETVLSDIKGGGNAATIH